MTATNNASCYAPRMLQVSRRDFLNGMALAIAPGLTPWAQISADPVRYPPERLLAHTRWLLDQFPFGG